MCKEVIRLKLLHIPTAAKTLRRNYSVPPYTLNHPRSLTAYYAAMTMACFGGAYLYTNYIDSQTYALENNPNPDLKLNPNSPNKYILVCGPSGVGKGTLIKELFLKYPHLTSFSVSYTTRKPRPGEQNGKDYNFVSEEEFLSEIKEGNFLEHVHFADKRYGTGKKFIDCLMEQGKVCVLDVDIQGAKSVSESDYKGVLIFIKPPTYQSLEDRL